MFWASAASPFYWNPITNIWFMVFGIEVAPGGKESSWFPL
jgi:hypothetical protein